MTTFEISGNDFALDGEPFRVLSGTIHYFRVPKEYWADRIHKARLMGLNTIETYVPWSLHEPLPGVWEDSGRLDLGAFLDAIEAEGMKAIVRPGPYICAEFSGGGLPGWLFRDAPAVAHLNNREAAGHTPVRSLDPAFMEPATNYFRRVYDIVAPRQITRDGSVILVQIENEYGAYGNNHEYLQALTDLTRACGIDVPLTTVDQPAGTMLEDGTLPELVATGSFGSRSAERIARLRELRPTGPLMCSEFWDGWFDSWGEYHHVTDPAASAFELATLLEAGASVNLYMFHGGTNFGLTNGANDKGLYRPLTTSYDYDAPLDETGHPTPKYWAFREVLGRFTQLPDEVPSDRGPAPVRSGSFSAMAPLSALAHEWLPCQSLTMDSVGQYSGFALYRCFNDDDASTHTLTISEVRDRAIVHADGRRVGVLERMDYDQTMAFEGSAQNIEILVEDMGRVNYGPRIGEHKGLIGPILLDGEETGQWEIAPLDLDNLAPVLASLNVEQEGEEDVAVVGKIKEPTFVGAEIDLDEPADLFLDTRGWGHGLVWFNGNLLGRYNRRGPQRTLYVPAPYVRAGANQLLVLETDPVVDMRWGLLEGPDLGPIDW